MLSIIDEMLIGLVWKLEVGVKWDGWGLTRGLRGESRAFWGINSQDKSHYRTAQERLHAKWPHGGGIMACVCLCARTIHLPRPFLAVTHKHRQAAVLPPDFFSTQITTTLCIHTRMHTLAQTGRDTHRVASVLFH